MPTNKMSIPRKHSKGPIHVLRLVEWQEIAGLRSNPFISTYVNQDAPQASREGNCQFVALRVLHPRPCWPR